MNAVIVSREGSLVITLLNIEEFYRRVQAASEYGRLNGPDVDNTGNPLLVDLLSVVVEQTLFLQNCILALPELKDLIPLVVNPLVKVEVSLYFEDVDPTTVVAVYEVLCSLGRIQFVCKTCRNVRKVTNCDDRSKSRKGLG